MGCWIAAFSIFAGLSMAWLERTPDLLPAEMLLADIDGGVKTQFVKPHNNSERPNSYPVDIYLDPEGHQIEAVEVVVEYDPRHLNLVQVEDQSVSIGAGFKLESVSEKRIRMNQLGAITLSAFQHGEAVDPDQAGTLARLWFQQKTKNPGEVTIRSDQSVVITQDSLDNALGKVKLRMISKQNE